MIRLIALASLASLAGCTLLLPTNELITPCTVQEDCEAGFVCETQACVPEDVDDGNASG
jgi:hypothetical protein